MKLLKKIVPLATVVTTTAGVVPMVTSCTTDDGNWIDGTKLYDTSNFDYYTDDDDNQIAVYDEEGHFDWLRTTELATEIYIAQFDENPDLIYNDFKSSLNQWNHVITLLPQYIQFFWTNELIPQVVNFIIKRIGGFKPNPKTVKLITILVNMIIPYSPIRTVKINKLRGKLNDFVVEHQRPIYGQWLSPLASYNEAINVDLSFPFDFDFLPDFVIQFIEEVLGIKSSFEIRVEATAETQMTKIPVCVWGDTLVRTKKQMISLIGGGSFDDSQYYGLSFMPNIQDSEFLSTNQEWQGKMDLSVNVELVGRDVSIKVFGGSADSLVFDYDLWHELFDRNGNSTEPNRVSIPIWLALAIEAVGGWSTYYYYDQICPEPDDMMEVTNEIAK